MSGLLLMGWWWNGEFLGLVADCAEQADVHGFFLKQLSNNANQGFGKTTSERSNVGRTITRKGINDLGEVERYAQSLRTCDLSEVENLWMTYSLPTFDLSEVILYSTLDSHKQ
ncbi:MAG: hypothetical protein ACKVUS_03195 [Saprospiraceae bacterium]